MALSPRYDYRADIDGLRCIAVVSVVLYHLQIDTAAGGFFGVDVFFVISGFLITGLILAELEGTGHFQAKEFYLRRLRRLFPAFVATVAGCIAIAVVLFTPQDLERLGGSSVTTALGLSNFFFWQESGYFDASVSVKPLLHTWSLSVEAQFYLMWPVLLWAFVRVFGTRPGPLLVLFVTCAVVSFAVHVVFSDGFTAFAFLGDLFADGPASTFYLTPFRIFEFAMGAALVPLAKSQFRRRRIADELGSLLGFALILYAVVTRDETAAARSFDLLIPCIGAALLIGCGRSSYSAALLRTPVAVGIGKISYSLYLVHWPLIVFYDYIVNGPLDAFDKAILFGLSLGTAVLLHRCVEQPFRRPPRGIDRPGLATVLGPAGVLLLVPVTALGSALWTQQGWPWRVMDPVPVAASPTAPCEDHQRQPCPLDGQEAFDTIWVGDSLAEHYAPVLENDSRFAEIMFSRGGCPMLPLMTRLRDGVLDHRCLELTDAAYALIENTHNKNIVLALYWRAYFGQNPELVVLRDGAAVEAVYGSVLTLLKAALHDLHARTTANGHSVFIVDHVQDEELADWRRCRNTPLRLCSGLMQDVSVDRLNAQNPLDPEMISLFAELGFKYFNPLENFCDRETGTCPPLRDDSRSLMSDHIHFSREGARVALLGGRVDFFKHVMNGTLAD